MTSRTCSNWRSRPFLRPNKIKWRIKCRLRQTIVTRTSYIGVDDIRLSITLVFFPFSIHHIHSLQSRCEWTYTCPYILSCHICVMRCDTCTCTQYMALNDEVQYYLCTYKENKNLKIPQISENGKNKNKKVQIHITTHSTHKT